MKVLYDHQTFAMQKHGGISRYFYETIKRMPSHGVKVSLFMGYFINKYGLENYKSLFESFRGKEYKEIPKTKLISLALSNFLFKRFEKKTKYDVYHQTYYHNLIPNPKGKRVVTVLDMTHEYFPASFSKLDKSSDWKGESVAKADGIICISESTKNDLLKTFKINETKVRVIYLGNSIEKDIQTERIIKEKYILFVGARKGYKNFDLLLKAYSELDEIRNNYKLVCYGGGSFSKEENEAIQSKKLQGRVILESGDDKRLANLYKYAEVFVYPSKYEGFGIPPLEAMSLGCPMIASNISSIPEVVGDAGLYIDPESKDDLKKSLSSVLLDEKLSNDLKLRGFRQAEKFSWEKCADEHIDFYKTLLGR